MSAVKELIGDSAALATRRAMAISEHLREQLLGIGGGNGRVASHAEKAWASLTFSGARHTLCLVFAGPEEVQAGEDIVSVLSEHEFSIPGQLVADAAVTEVTHKLGDAPRMVVTVELLLLEEK